MQNPIYFVRKFYVAAGKALAFFILFLLIIQCSFGQTNTTAVKGILNLQAHSWEKDGIAGLNGEWEFYWNALYTPAAFDSARLTPTAYAVIPDFWNDYVPNKGFMKPAFGYATYRLIVRCPTTAEQLQLKFLTVASAYKLYINGRQLAEIGKVGTSEATTVPSFQPLVVNATPVNNQLDIIIQVANFTYSTGGLWDFIKLGTPELIRNYQVKSISHDFFIAGSFFLMGIFYMVIYFFFKRRTSPLYFAIFCILIGMRSLVTGELGIYYITNWSWQFIKHIEFLFLYLTVPVLSLFSYQLFPAEFSKKVLRYILLISVPFIVITLFTSPQIFRYTLHPFQLIMLVTACYGLYVYICAVKNKRTGSVYLLAGFIILFITIINDILYNSLIIQSTNLLYAGLYILVICQATTLSRQFFQAYKKVEKLNKQLEQVNSELNLKNETINETNEQLSRLNAELDSLVFRTSHDLRSPITSMYAMADVIKEAENAEVRNEYIDFQKKTILRLDALINEILRYAKNKSTALQYEETELDAVVKNALQDHVFSYNSQKIERILDIKQQHKFVTDKYRLNMIINNLISNALKHHNTAKENPYVKISACVTQQQAEITVQDNGQGIPEDQLGHIFTMFYTGNTTTSGTGFGLYIVKEAVAKLGGTIKVQSAINTGTTFFVVIPNGAVNAAS